MCYRYTNPLCAEQLYYTQFPWIVKREFHFFTRHAAPERKSGQRVSDSGGKHRMERAGRCNLNGKDVFYQTPPRNENQRCTAISQLIEAVAEQQESLARILEAEHRKIEKTTQLYNTDVDDLVRIDDSVERILAVVTRLELAIQLKLDLFRDCLCPDAPCSGYHTACTK